MNQRDLICTECPLDECDEGSLWCVLRLIEGNPNAAQARYVTLGPKPRKKKFDRKAYGVAYRRDHREEKRQYDRDRYQARKNGRELENRMDAPHV